MLGKVHTSIYHEDRKRHCPQTADLLPAIKFQKKSNRLDWKSWAVTFSFYPSDPSRDPA
jgi:hypothetical protein